MSVTFITANPKALLQAFDARIEQKEKEGKVTTWEKHADGKHYTHRATDSHQKAFFAATVVEPRKMTSGQTEPGKLVFNIVRPQGKSIDGFMYAYYHGHLIETFLTHFPGKFTDAVASGTPQGNDLV